MIIFQDSSGVSHQINSPESLAKAMGVPESRTTVIMTDENGQFLSAGKTAGELGRNAELVKSLRAGTLAKSGTVDNGADDRIIQLNQKQRADKTEARKKVVNDEKMILLSAKKQAAKQAKKGDLLPAGADLDDDDDEAEEMSKSFRSGSRIGLLGIIAELQALKDAQG